MGTLVGVSGLAPPPKDETKVQYENIDIDDLKDTDSRSHSITIDQGFTATHMAVEEYSPQARNEFGKSDNTVMKLWFGGGKVHEDRSGKTRDWEHNAAISQSGTSNATITFEDFKSVHIRLRLSLLKRAD